MSTSTRWFTWRTAAAAAAMALASGVQAAVPELLIYKDIGENWWSEDPLTAAAFREELAAVQAAEIRVRILSGGGSVPDGLAIYNALRDHPARIVTINDGLAASIASLIFCAGDERICAANAMTMVHAPWTYAGGNAQQLRDTADMLDAWAAAMAASYAAATGKTKDAVITEWMDGRDHYLTAEDALAAGLATAVGAATTDPQASTAIQGVLARLGTSRAVNAAGAPFRFDTPAAAAAQHQEHHMPQANQPAAPANTTAGATTTTSAPSAADLEAARREGAQAESARRAAISAACQPHLQHPGLADVQAACLADPAITVDQANTRILAALASGATPSGNRVTTVQDERDTRVAAAVQVIMARAMVKAADGKPVSIDRGNPFAGMSLLDMARTSLARAGINTAGLDKMQVVGAAFTQGTGDFPILLENAMHKTLQAAYAVAPDTWSRFCRRGSVSDFRAHPRYRIGSIGNLQAKNELGEFKYGSIPDGEKAAITAATKGLLINISREAIINDDLAAFVGLADALGRSAKRTIEVDVYALLASNPTLNDGVALFHASHGNLVGTGTAPTVSVIDSMRQLMASQKDVSGNDFLDLRPAVVLAPLSLGGTLRVLNANEFDPSVSNKFQVANIVRGLFRDVVDTPRLTGTGYYMFADPNDAPALEVAFLDGNDMPFLDQQAGWSVDGTQYKVRHDYGVGAIDYRGAVYNPGA